jgi:thioredoxin 1
MKKAIAVFATAVTLLAASCSHAQKVEEIPPATFAREIKSTNAILVDVRTPEEYKEGHLQNALNIDWLGDGFEQSAAKLDKTKPVYVYCRSGKRSSDAAEKMKELGFEKVYELDGGISAWEDAKLPIEK